jgi:hypothetical protein
MIAMGTFASSISRAFNFDSLSMYLRALLFFGFMEIVLGRGFLHMPQISDILLPVVSSIISFEAVVEVPILVTFVFILWRRRDSVVSRILMSLIVVTLMVVVVLYYFSLSGSAAPAILWVSFVLLALATIVVSAVKRVSAAGNEDGGLSRLVLLGFLVLAALTYAFVYGYNLSLSLVSHFGIRLISEPVRLFALAQNLLVADALLLFLYSLSAPCGGFSFNRKVLFKVLVFPSLLVLLLLVASVVMPSGSRFDMVQIISLMLTMWGFAISKPQVFLYLVMFWFFLVGALLLREKGRASSVFFQEFVGVFLMFVGGFLLLSPYMLMGVIAFILFSTNFA